MSLDQDSIDLIKKINQFLGALNDYVEIYDKNKNKVISNKNYPIWHKIYPYSSKSYYQRIMMSLDKLFLKKYMYDNIFDNDNKSFFGKTSHILVPRAIIIDNNNNYQEKSFISSYIPIIRSDQNDARIDSVIYIITDITNQWNYITSVEKKIYVIFLIIFLLFFIMIIYNTNYVQDIIDKQIETNKLLETEKSKVETENLAKTDFLANMSHELRTPLNAIIGFSDIIMADNKCSSLNKQYKSYITDINNSGKHLLSVINDILDFSKASADKLTVNNIEIDLNKLILSSMRFVQTKADQASIKLIMDIPKEHVIIQADPKRLKQALLNILSNAVKFTLSNGSVTVTLQRDKKNKLVNIITSDTGIGMKEQDIPKALSLFGQVDSKLSKKHAGTGLGLPLTKKLIELMGGTFFLKSEIKKGTVVTITFPYYDSIEM